MAITLSRVEFLRAVYKKSYEEEVVQDLINHLANSSLRQYESGWKRFQQWLRSRPHFISSSVVASFLVFCSQSLSPRTVLTIRAALALPLLEGMGISLEHRHFQMLAKTAFRRKPPAPKVVPSWSLDQALQALTNIPQERLGPREIFFKALFLTAIASANRASELAAIERSRVALRQQAIILPVKPGFVFKNQAQFHSPSLIEIPNLPDSPLCPVRALEAYLEVTKHSSEDALFLHPSSGKALNAARLGFFLAKAVQWLLPGSKAKAHDTRRLSTTHASLAGVSAQSIVNAGSWRSLNTFISRYLVPVNSTAGTIVLARNRVTS